MPTRRDRKLAELLEKQSLKWRAKLNGFEDIEAHKLRAIFSNLEREKRLFLLAFLDTMEVDANGVIVNGNGNRQAMLQALKGMQDLNIKHLGRDSDFAKWVDRTYARAAKMGINKTKNAYRLGEGGPLPRGYRPPTKRYVNNAKRLLLNQMSAQGVRDREIVKRAVLTRMYDPAGTPASLRRDLVNTGQLEGMLDSAGRRVTASVRADRIAHYELAEVASVTHRETMRDIYDTDDPNELHYWWNQIQRATKADEHVPFHKDVRTEAQWVRRAGKLPPTRPHCGCDTTLVRAEWFSPEVRGDVFKANGVPLTV